MTYATTQMEITPQLMAEAFWNMDSTQQTEFFSELAKVINKDYEVNKKAYSLGELQWCFMSDEMRKEENKEARDMLMTMASFLYWYTLGGKCD